MNVGVTATVTAESRVSFQRTAFGDRVWLILVNQAEDQVMVGMALPELRRIRMELNKAELELTVLQTGPDIRTASEQTGSNTGTCGVCDGSAACDPCEGYGDFSDGEECPACAGSGECPQCNGEGER